MLFIILTFAMVFKIFLFLHLISAIPSTPTLLYFYHFLIFFLTSSFTSIIFIIFLNAFQVLINLLSFLNFFLNQILCSLEFYEISIYFLNNLSHNNLHMVRLHVYEAVIFFIKKILLKIKKINLHCLIVAY